MDEDLERNLEKLRANKAKEKEKESEGGEEQKESAENEDDHIDEEEEALRVENLANKEKLNKLFAQVVFFGRFV